MRFVASLKDAAWPRPSLEEAYVELLRQSDEEVAA
jgi:hypothetical protein